MTDNNQEEVKKKRGRKPKPKNVDEENIPKIPKKYSY